MRELAGALRELHAFQALAEVRPTDCDTGASRAIMALVNAKRDDPGTTTLGALLYADTAIAPVTEQTWVGLVEAIAAGDQQALRSLYDMSHRIVFTLAVRICGRRELAEEVMLDVFHDVWRRSAQYDAQNGSVVGWLMMQARSRALDRLRFEQRKKRVDPNVETDVPPPAGGPGDALDASDRRRTLDGALATLTPDEREAIETAFFYELTYAETATRLEQPIGTVKTRVRSALAKLRKALAKDGGSP